MNGATTVGTCLSLYWRAIGQFPGCSQGGAMRAWSHSLQPAGPSDPFMMAYKYQRWGVCGASPVSAKPMRCANRNKLPSASAREIR
jgi:hypothetical protein